MRLSHLRSTMTGIGMTSRDRRPVTKIGNPPIRDLGQPLPDMDASYSWPQTNGATMLEDDCTICSIPKL